MLCLVRYSRIKQLRAIDIVNTYIKTRELIAIILFFQNLRQKFLLQRDNIKDLLGETKKSPCKYSVYFHFVPQAMHAAVYLHWLLL